MIKQPNFQTIINGVDAIKKQVKFAQSYWREQPEESAKLVNQVVLDLDTLMNQALALRDEVSKHG